MAADALTAFAEEVGTPCRGPVCVVGGRTQWDIGGSVARGAREVRAPQGVVSFEPAEMTVRVRAATTVADLDDGLAEAGQTVAMPSWPGATVGGVLAVGHSGVFRLGYGPVRDTLLEARVVTAEGRLVKAGGPTVKNVSGYDLCRLLVGSLGTLGFVAEVVLRTRPLPANSRWFAGPADPFALHRQLHRPTALLWDGTTTWLCLEGHPDDVESEADQAELDPVDGPPPLPGHRRSLQPDELRGLQGRFVAEVGVGVVHVPDPVPSPPLDPPVAELHCRVKAAFDPTGRLNPGRRPELG